MLYNVLQCTTIVFGGAIRPPGENTSPLLHNRSIASLLQAHKHMSIEELRRIFQVGHHNDGKSHYALDQWSKAHTNGEFRVVFLPFGINITAYRRRLFRSNSVHLVIFCGPSSFSSRLRNRTNSFSSESAQ